ncbi:MAG: hypothetical protein RL391_840 [Actinomycetota bacterium]
MKQSARDPGSVAVEMVILTPLLVLLTIFAVFAGRSTEGLTGVQHAADQGARAASKVSFGRMEVVGRQAVLKDLQMRRVACAEPQITVQRGDGGRTVTVSVRCSPSDEGLALLGVTPPILEGISTEVIDFYRGGDE